MAGAPDPRDRLYSKYGYVASLDSASAEVEPLLERFPTCTD